MTCRRFWPKKKNLGRAKKLDRTRFFVTLAFVDSLFFVLVLVLFYVTRNLLLYSLKVSFGMGVVDKSGSF